MSSAFQPHFCLLSNLSLGTSSAGQLPLHPLGDFRPNRLPFVPLHPICTQTDPHLYPASRILVKGKGKDKGSPYSMPERRVPELISVLSSQLAGNVSHKPGGRLLLLSARPAVTLATLKRAATIFAAW